mgnify:CR=1 FL=1
MERTRRKKEQKRLLPVEYVIAAILVLVIVAGVWMAMRADAGKRKRVEGTYSCEYLVNGKKEQSVVVYYKFDADQGTYEEVWGERSLMTGSYTIEGDIVTLVSDGKEEIGAESETMTCYLEGDLLIPHNYIYEGTVPEEDVFDAQCTMTDSAGQEYVAEFSKDGGYTYTIRGMAGGGDSVIKGTYEREGNFLHRKNDDGAPLTDFYIYQGKLAGIFYTKE